MAELRAIALRAADHAPHRLHAPDRPWPETNCYIDLWIELLHAIGRDPLPLLGLAAALDWEGDHFTFLKPSAADLSTLAGIVMHELALWDETAAHVATQLEGGAIPLLEVDAFFLPDTHASAYRTRHTKTTIAITATDPDQTWLEYIHNAGLFRLAGEDYEAILGTASPLFPYAELARIAPPPDPAPDPAVIRAAALETLSRLAATRRPGDPIARFAAALPALFERTRGDPTRIHALCFNTTRQLGAAFGLLADHLAWLGAGAGAAWVSPGADAAWLADSAKSLQFQISRAARRGRDDPAIAETLAEMSTVWRRLTAAGSSATVRTGSAVDPIR